MLLPCQDPQPAVFGFWCQPAAFGCVLLVHLTASGKTHWYVACAALQPCQRENRSLFSQNRTDRRLQNVFFINLSLIPGLLLQLWLSTKVISNQFSICLQHWYRQLICSLQRPDVPHIVSYRS